MTRLTPRTNGLVQGFAAASISTNTTPTTTPTSSPTSSPTNNDIPQVKENAASSDVERTIPPPPNSPDSISPSTPIKTPITPPRQTKEEATSSSRSTRESAPSPPSITRSNTSNRAPVSRLPSIPPNDPLILKIKHHLLIDYDTAASFHKAIISSSDAAIIPVGSSEYFDKLAPLYAHLPREVQRCGFLKALVNQYGLWVGLGHRSMTMIDYGCGVGALSQALSPHVSKILAIDSSKGMVDLYNATLGGNRECAMGAVQGDLVAGVLLERGEGDGTGMLGAPKRLGQRSSLLGFCLSIDFLCTPSLPYYSQDILVRTLEILLLNLEDNGILLVIDIEKVLDNLWPGPNTPAYGQEFLRGGRKVRGYSSKEIADACVELELSDIQVLEGVEYRWEGDDGEGGRKVRSEMWFMLRARKGARFMGRVGRRFPGVHRGDVHSSR